jgi:hypothetical protein
MINWIRAGAIAVLIVAAFALVAIFITVLSVLKPILYFILMAAVLLVAITWILKHHLDSK